VRLDPANPLALVALSRALEAVGDLEGALARSTEAVALEPDSWRHLQRVGIVAMRARSFEQAVEYLGRACENSGNQETCANLAVALHRAGRAEEALEVATRAAAGSASPWGAYNLACLRALRGEHDAALAALRDAFELGFADVLITSDPDLDSLRGDRRFEVEVEKVLGRIRSRRSIATTVFPWQE
jgi:tetratricopeptide (TPR) repeat protein